MAHTIVIFGASGDLTSRKLVPALYEVFQKGRLPEATRIVGFARTPQSDDSWREKLRGSTAAFLGEALDAAVWQSLAASIHYLPGDIAKPEDFAALGRRLDELEGGAEATRIYYLATAPQLYEPAIAALGAAGLAAQDHGPRRIVIEKPFGTNLETARHLNAAVHKVFAENQVFRIDHYLGKETVQNVLVFRFANSIFEPVWNRNFIDHVQITAAEEVTVGHRGAYYDSVGVLRDMFQNHLLQLLTLTAMESPSRFEADSVRDEKVKVLRAIRPMTPRGRLHRHHSRPISQVSRRARRAAGEPDGHLRRGEARRSTIGGGRASPSCCGAARRWPARRRRSSSSFAPRRT